MKQKYRALLIPSLVLVYFFVVLQVNAAAKFDISFNQSLAHTNGELNEGIVQPDGEIIIYGRFESIYNDA